MKEYDEDCISKPEMKYEMNAAGYPKFGQPQLTGVGGTETLIFKGSGQVGCKKTVSLAYAQPWNFDWVKNGSLIQTITLEVEAPTLTKTLKDFVKDDSGKSVFDLP